MDCLWISQLCADLIHVLYDLVLRRREAGRFVAQGHRNVMNKFPELLSFVRVMYVLVPSRRKKKLDIMIKNMHPLKKRSTKQLSSPNLTLHLLILHLRSRNPMLPIHRSATPIHALGENIHLRRSELPRTDFLLKQQIQLRESATAGFRKAEVSVSDTQEADPSPEEAGVIPPIPRAGVEHVRCEDAVDDPDDVVSVAAEDDGFDL
jgi:hypothetical protein